MFKPSILSHSLAIFVLIVSLPSTAAEQHQCRVQLAGDSTMQIQDFEHKPEFGWGQVLPDYARQGTAIFNFAKGGRSSKTFILEQRWKSLLDNTEPGDWVLIQFGHNDAAFSKQERYTAPVDFAANLRRMVSDVRAKKARPILITPVARRHFDNEGKLRDIHGIYPSLVEQVSRELQVPMIDLFGRSSEHLLKLGVLESIKLYVHIGPGVHPCCPEGLIDNTHFTRRGALDVAGLVIDELHQQGLVELADCFNREPK